MACKVLPIKSSMMAGMINDASINPVIIIAHIANIHSGAVSGFFSLLCFWVLISIGLDLVRISFVFSRVSVLSQ